MVRETTWRRRIAFAVILTSAGGILPWLWLSCTEPPTAVAPVSRRSTPVPSDAPVASAPTRQSKIKWEDHVNADGSPKFSEGWSEFQAWAHAPKHWIWRNGWTQEREIEYPSRSPVVYTTMEPAERGGPIRERREAKQRLHLSPQQRALFDEMVRLYRAADIEAAERVERELLSLLGSTDDDWTAEHVSKEALGERGLALTAQWRHRRGLSGSPLRDQEKAYELLASLPTEDIVALLADPDPTVEGERIPPLLVSLFLSVLDGYAEPPNRFALSDRALERLMDIVRRAPLTPARVADDAPPEPDLVRLLEFSRGDAAVPLLLDLLRDESPTDRASATRAKTAADVLKGISYRQPLSAEVIGTIRSLWESHMDAPFGSEGWARSQSLLDILKRAYGPEENSYFVTLAASPASPVPVRVAVMDRLRVFDPAERDLLMRLATEDASGEVRARAMTVLWSENLSRPSSDLAAFLLREISRSEFPEVRTLLTLGNSGTSREPPPEIVAELRRQAESDPDPGVKSRAADTLERIRESAEGRRRIQAGIDAAGDVEDEDK